MKQKYLAQTRQIFIWNSCTWIVTKPEDVSSEVYKLETNQCQKLIKVKGCKEESKPKRIKSVFQDC